MKLKSIKNSMHLIRLLSFLWLFACLTPTTIAATTEMASQNQQPAVAVKQTAEKPALKKQDVKKPAVKQQTIKKTAVKKKKPSTAFKQVKTFPALLQSGELKMSDIPDPHWKENGCIACHKSTKANASAKNVRHKAIEKTCYNCHSPRFDHRYIHPDDIQPDKAMLARMDKAMRSALIKSKNIINCTTCHNLTLQCKAETRSQKYTNPKFFRSGEQESRSQLCFSCHDKDQYQRLDPHDQIDEQGKLRPEKCYVCHADSIERLNRITDIGQLQFNAKESLVTMCWGCHPWKPHPGGQFTFFKKGSGPDHLIKPPERIKQRLEKMTKKNHIEFPLEPETGRIFCGTCHNAHEKGVIKNPEKAKGADSKKRLRDKEICIYCHLK